jgi:transcriptional regulator
MHVPEQYRAPDPSWELGLIQAYPLALLVTNGPQGPSASHVPVILQAEAGPAEGAGLRGLVLTGHMNRKNPHWERLTARSQGVLVFQGPHSYVSPTYYEKTPAAPTWNFTVVHARGRVSTIDDPAATLKIVESTVSAFEARFGAEWDKSGSAGYFDELLPGVGAFEMTVDSVESMFKLSQEQHPDIRLKVCSAFAEDEVVRRRRLAELMNSFGAR